MNLKYKKLGHRFYFINNDYIQYYLVYAFLCAGWEKRDLIGLNLCCWDSISKMIINNPSGIKIEKHEAEV